MLLELRYVSQPGKQPQDKVSLLGIHLRQREPERRDYGPGWLSAVWLVVSC